MVNNGTSKLLKRPTSKPMSEERDLYLWGCSCDPHCSCDGCSTALCSTNCPGYNPCVDNDPGDVCS
jgi:hypothetical protein